MSFREGYIFKHISNLAAAFLIPASMAFNVPVSGVPDTAPITDQPPIISQINISDISETFLDKNGESKAAVQEVAVDVITPVNTVKPNSVQRNTTTPVVSVDNSIQNSITIGGKTINTFYTDSTKIDAGTRVAKFREKFFFGHNTNAVFSHLKNLPIGTTFTVSENGETYKYVIKEAVTMEKPEVAKIMNSIVAARHSGVRYDLSIMTCAGENLGGGDATHRLIIFASRI